MKIFYYILCIFILCCTGCSNSKLKENRINILPGIKSFIKENESDYGNILRVREKLDWAEGERQQVTTTKGSFLFYLKGDLIVGVWKFKDNGEREQVYKTTITPKQEKKDVPSSEELPAYTVLDKVDLLDGGVYGDILITSYSRSTSKDIREKILRQISKKEGFTEAALYSTIEAYKANESASYLKSNPNALKKGYLGHLKNNEFTEGEILFP